MPVRREVAAACTGRWKHEMFAAPTKAPHQCLYGCCCICCASYQQRIELLDFTGEPYICCAGLCPCGPLGEPQERSCLFLEACCCPGMALSGNRFFIQTRFDRENTACDDCIITCSCLFYFAVQCAQCFCDVPPELEFLADCVVMTVDGCMHAQQHLELQEIKKNGYAGPPPAVLAALPPAQAQMCSAAKPGAGLGGGAPAMAVGASSMAWGAQAKPKPRQVVDQASAQPPQMSYATPLQRSMHQQQPQAQRSISQPQHHVGHAPLVQRSMTQAQAAPITVRCGSCGKHFGSPSYGVTVACPFCQAHNVVPPAMGQVVVTGVGMRSGGDPYSNGYGGGAYGGGSAYDDGGRRRGPGGMAMAAGAGAGLLGGMMMADILF